MMKTLLFLLSKFMLLFDNKRQTFLVTVVLLILYCKFKDIASWWGSLTTWLQRKADFMYFVFLPMELLAMLYIDTLV